MTDKVQNHQSKKCDDCLHDKVCHQCHTFKEKLQHYVGTLQQAPKFLQDELKYIRNGYRINFSQKRHVLKSLFMWHNEVINIWTHLLPAIFILMLIFYLYFYYDELLRPKVIERFNEQIQSFFEEVKIIEDKINQQLLDGMDTLSKDVDDMIYLEEQFKEKANSIAFSLSAISVPDFHDFQEKLNTAILNNTWSSDIIESFENYRKSAMEVLETKTHNWIDIYVKLANTENQNKQVILSNWPIVGFLITAIICLGGSAIFHTFYCISQTANKILIRIDYAGICFLICGSTYAPTFYGFYCNMFYAYFYCSIQGLLAIIVFTLTMFDFFHTIPWRATKNWLYLFLGILSGLPELHLLLGDSKIVNGFSFLTQLPYYLLMGVAYIGGLAIFSFRCPEKQHPGKFDNCGNSHQIWHVCVVIAIFFTYIASINAYYARFDYPCPVQ